MDIIEQFKEEEKKLMKAFDTMSSETQLEACIDFIRFLYNLTDEKTEFLIELREFITNND